MTTDKTVVTAFKLSRCKSTCYLSGNRPVKQKKQSMNNKNDPATVHLLQCADYFVRKIELFKICNILVRQFHIKCAHCIVKVLHFGCSDDR